MNRASYGIDAPGAVRANIVLGAVFAVIAAASFAWRIPAWAVLGATFLAALCFFYAAVMLWSSLAGKKRLCARLVTALALSGNERVLDAGCGRGLALIACAKKLTTGKAIGIDLWAARDQSNNTPEATRANAAAEGVTDRVDVETGDITKLPFPAASFDAIISMIVLHNIPSREGRDQALLELARVLKPGGRMVLYDLLHTARYAQVLRNAGLTVEVLSRETLWLLPSHALLARKP
ncbi:MAG: class I SAM-dependent methyltransferase [Proteobacteria bacterium]|nr:class I SAM-dependent methyltransferase [Pseudomonadota bacterium]